ncbi:MAG: DUF6745 domain-containing protein [Cyanobacteria bacterium P01_A01_bin.83]
MTSQQESLIFAIIDEWIRVPFGTSPVNKVKAEAAINLTYESAGENPPQKIIWFDNPSEAVIWMIENIEDLEHPQYFSAVSFNLYWDDILYDLEQLINPEISQKFRNSFNEVFNIKYLHYLSQSFLADFLNSHLRFHLQNLWGEPKYLLLHRYFEDIEDVEVHAMHEIYNLAATSFYHAMGTDCSKFRGYWEAAKYCGLWWAFYDVAVVTPKPSAIYLDSEYRLHAIGKPALIYKGFESYAQWGKYTSKI